MVTKIPWNWQAYGRHFALSPILTASEPKVLFFGRSEPEIEGASMQQVHGADVRLAEAQGPHPNCDGLVTRTQGLALLVRTADCLPLVLWRPGVVGVCHAGWRGLRGGVIENLIAAMGHPEEIHAWIGPGIRPCCFDVGSEVAARFPRSTVTELPGKPRVDLAGEAGQRLNSVGVSCYGDSRSCTRCRQHLFFSHRGSGGGAGRNLTVAFLGGV